MRDLAEFAAGFDEEPGYLDFARVGPIGRAVLEEQRALTGLLGRARFGSLSALSTQDERVRRSVSALTGFRHDQIVFQPSTTVGLMQAIFGHAGRIALSPAEYPSMPVAAVRAAQALGDRGPVWLATDHDRVTPGMLREQLDPACTAVAVSLVDFRTGYLADLDGIRQVIGDRLLIVDAVQGFGIVDAPFEVADVVASGGQKWMRAGWGTGFLALSDRAVESLVPVLSGPAGSADPERLDEVLPPAAGAAAFSMGNPDPIAQAMFATALEDVAEVGVAAISDRISEIVSAMIDLADEFAVPVASARAEKERAGILVLDPPADHLTQLTASLFNHGISATTRGGRVRLSAHATTTAETLDMLRGAFMSFASAIVR